MGKHRRSMSSQEGRKGSQRSRSRDNHHRSRRDKSSYSRQSPKQLARFRESSKIHKHLYFLTNESMTIGRPYAAWNIAIKYAQRPSCVLVICEGMEEIANFKRSYRLNRPLHVIDQNLEAEYNLLLRRNLEKLITQQKIQVVLISQKKCSIVMSVQNYIQLFDLIINTTDCYDPDFYSQLIDLIIQKGIIVSFCDKERNLSRVSEAFHVQPVEIFADLTQEEKNRQLLSDIQFHPKPTSEALALIKMLPYSAEETAARLLDMQMSKFRLPSSLHLNMPGYVTYRLDLDVEFNSLKYVWNFLKEELPDSFLDQIKGMQKFQNQKGVVMNIPEQLKYMMEILCSRLKKNKKKYKGIEAVEVTTALPKLQDINSEEYQLLKQKKKFAMDHKEQLQIFIGGIPYDMKEAGIRKIFQDCNVNLFMVRILRDGSGFSKGIAFGLCENREHFERALTLSGTKLGDRCLRIKLANQKKE